MFTRNRWLVFTLIGLVMLPVSIVASRTSGADVNHYGLFSYFLLVSATLAMGDAALSGTDAFLTKVSKIFIVILVALNVDLQAFRVALGAYAHLDSNPAQKVYQYSLNHPGRAYFPWNPLAVLLGEGKLYHFDYSLYDREVRGYPVSPAQMLANIPANPKLVAIPPNEVAGSAALLNLINGKPRVNEPGLENWTVYQISP
jgi:hypothetical protein